MNPETPCKYAPEFEKKFISTITKSSITVLQEIKKDRVQVK